MADMDMDMRTQRRDNLTYSELTSKMERDVLYRESVDKAIAGCWMLTKQKLEHIRGSLIIGVNDENEANEEKYLNEIVELSENFQFLRFFKDSDWANTRGISINESLIFEYRAEYKKLSLGGQHIRSNNDVVIARLKENNPSKHAVGLSELLSRDDRTDIQPPATNTKPSLDTANAPDVDIASIKEMLGTEFSQESLIDANHNLLGLFGKLLY